MAMTITKMSFPADLVRMFPGLAMDIGGSAAKFIFQASSDWKAMVLDKDTNYGTLTFLTCGKSEISGAIEKIRMEIHLCSTDQETKIYSCGNGVSNWNKRLIEAFNVKIENVNELDCLWMGLLFFLDKVPQTGCVHPPMTELIQVQTDLMQNMCDVWKTYDQNATFLTIVRPDATVSPPSSVTLSSELSMAEALGDDLYPSVLLNLGSANFIISFDKERQPLFTSLNCNGSKRYMGIASLLTGVKSYDEIIDLAESGNYSNIDLTMSGIVNAESDMKDDPYAFFGTTQAEQTIFAFGKAVNADLGDFKKEDLSSSWLLSHIRDIMNVVYCECIIQGAKNIFVTGSFANREFVRKCMTMELIQQKSSREMFCGMTVSPQLFFVKNGGLLSAFGAALRSSNKAHGDENVQ